MAFFWGAVLTAVVVLNTYLSLPSILNLIQVQGSAAILQSISSGDIAVIASLLNGFVAGVLCLRAIIAAFAEALGAPIPMLETENNAQANTQMNGDFHHSNTQHTTRRHNSFIILCIGLTSGYILSNKILAHQYKSSTSSMQSKFDKILEDMALMQRQMTETTTAKDQCHLDSADRISELNGHLTAKDVLISKCQDSSTEASSVRAKLRNAQDQLRILQDRSASEMATLRKGMQGEIDKAKNQSLKLKSSIANRATQANLCISASGFL